MSGVEGPAGGVYLNTGSGSWPEVLDTVHHVYTVPFRYPNVSVNGWVDVSDAGVELVGDAGTITILEDEPIVEVVVVGSGVSLPNHNTVEWWGRDPCKGDPLHRQRIDGLCGQHPNQYHRRILSREIDSAAEEGDEAQLRKLRRMAYGLTRGFTIPGSLPGRFYENVSRFRIGGSSNRDDSAYGVSITAAGRSFGEPDRPVSYHKANYAVRLVDVIVTKGGARHETSRPPLRELPEKHRGRRVHRSPEDDPKLGPLRKPEAFETVHRVYSVPWHYPNVVLDGWLEYGDKGTELYAEHGSITVHESMPIVSVTSIFSGCSSPSYQMLEWWPGDEADRWLETKRLPVKGRLIRRQRVDNLRGQHPTSEMSVFLACGGDTERDLADKIHDLSYNHHFPSTSIMNGLYENVAYFRVGDTSRPGQVVKRVVLRGGSEDLEDPYQFNSRYPADFNCRLLDVELRKDGPVRPVPSVNPRSPSEADAWDDARRLEMVRELNRRSMIPFSEEWSMRKRTGPKRDGIPFLKYGYAHFAPRDNWALGPIRDPQLFRIEHHVYASPFECPNIRIENAGPVSRYGVEMRADETRISITEEEPIVATYVVGSGSAAGGYVIVNWSLPGGEMWDPDASCPDSQMPRRVRVDSLNGQHPTRLNRGLLPPDRGEDAGEVLERLRRDLWRATDGFLTFSPLSGGIYENTAYARVGDTSRRDQMVFRVEFTAGALGGPAMLDDGEERYPGDYAIRLIDVMVRKGA